MKIEAQVPSLALSKRLKELGVKQESVFYWIKTYDDEYEVTDRSNVYMPKDTFYSAFTVAELGEMLPDEWQIRWHNGWGPVEGFGNSLPEDWYDNWIFEGMKRNQEADARAKMLIFLLEKKLVTL